MYPTTSSQLSHIATSEIENDVLDNDFELMNDLFEEIADDLAEVIQGGRGRCHAALSRN